MNMIDQKELLNIVSNHKHYTAARQILEKHETEFSIYSCNDDIVTQVVELNANEHFDELNELIANIKESNKREISLEKIFMEKETRYREKNAIDNFFEAFDNPETKERLFVVIGETGVGKSYIIEKRYPNIVQYACNSGLDPYSLCYYLADKDGSGLKPNETPFLKAIRNGGKIFLDEANELPQDTLMFIQGLTDEKKHVVIGDELVPISDQFKILMALNPPSETDERRPLGDALLGRAVGIVLELTDEIILERLGVTEKWLYTVRRLYAYIRQSGMVDVRDLNFRDYQRFIKYDFETQLQFKICMGDVTNIAEFSSIKDTGEYFNMIQIIYKEMRR